ncbi:alpha-N-arabinofuranosidase [Vigna unguiculata]|uniref:Alpha-N-arabinofuranosidase n=1 Tax=Vigna unguiculata TaxID=3917 RepID=A0A4D6M719_VIGUN|nr:alpha-N-arabinofuranosidase [Vigna unguiculata]
MARPDINHAGSGGLWAELVSNRGFEAGGPDNTLNIYPWSVIGNESPISVSINHTSCFERVLWGSQTLPIWWRWYLSLILAIGAWCQLCHWTLLWAMASERTFFQMVADLKPKFLRFPGGTYVEGVHLQNRYQRKDTIGPWEERPGHFDDIWNYWSDDGIGYFEYLRVVPQTSSLENADMYMNVTLSSYSVTSLDLLI